VNLADPAWTALRAWRTLGAYRLAEAEVVREQRVVTPDGRVWFVRRRWAKRRLPWKRGGPAGELGPAEREAVPVLPDWGEVLDSFGRLINWDVESGLLVAGALLVAGLLTLGVVVTIAWSWVLPILAANLVPIAVVLAVVAAAVLLDRLTRPWFIEAQSARLADAPRRIWRVQGWWRARRAFASVTAAIAEGRITAEHGTLLLTDRSGTP
jgi:hypothetical protein